MSLSKNIHAVNKNLQLVISVIVIIPVALAYGLYPKIVLSNLVGIKTDNINLVHIFRTMMGLYLGMTAIWMLGIIKPKFWLTAILTNIIFMGGLAMGRILSLILDGFPSKYFITGLLAELILAIWGLLILGKYRQAI